MANWLNVALRGTASWPNKEAKVSFGGQELILKPATKETEQSVHIELSAISSVDALTLINRFLSLLSWCDDQPMENLYGGSGSAAPVSISRHSRAVGSSFVFPFYCEMENNPKACLALALFREGRSSASNPFAFLSYFKILNIFWKDKYVKGRNEIIDGIRVWLPKLTERDVIKRIEDLKKVHGDIAEYLYQDCRCAIAHAFSDPIVDPDDVAQLRQLSQDIIIIKSIAEGLIEEVYGVPRTILGRGIGP